MLPFANKMQNIRTKLSWQYLENQSVQSPVPVAVPWCKPLHRPIGFRNQTSKRLSTNYNEGFFMASSFDLISPFQESLGVRSNKRMQLGCVCVRVAEQKHRLNGILGIKTRRQSTDKVEPWPSVRRGSSVKQALFLLFIYPIRSIIAYYRLVLCIINNISPIPQSLLQSPNCCDRQNHSRVFFMLSEILYDVSEKHQLLQNRGWVAWLLI